jgi:hypothetical protein
MITKKLLLISGVVLLCASSAWSDEPAEKTATTDTAVSTPVATPTTTIINKGNGFDVLNKTNSKIAFYINGAPFGGKSPANSYGTLTVSWGLLKVLCIFHQETCPVKIEWQTPEKTHTIETTINTETGIIGADKVLDATLPSLNAVLAAAKLPLEATLSNENSSLSGENSRDGYALVTVTHK